MRTINLYNKIIKHKNNMDVCYLVRKSFELKDKLKLKVAVQNMGFVESSDMFVFLNIYIDKADLLNWEICSNPEAKCLRYAKWRSIV